MGGIEPTVDWLRESLKKKTCHYSKQRSTCCAFRITREPSRTTRRSLKI